MFEYQESHFAALCQDGPVAQQILSLADKRSAAVRQFWTYAIGGAALAILGGALLFSAGWPTAAVLYGLVIVILTVVLCMMALGKVADAIKHPVLESLAATAGCSYTPQNFAPPVYEEARPPLFGNWLTTQNFTDLFTGTDAEGRRFAIYEAFLSRKTGKHTVTVFSGQVYAWQRANRVSQPIVIIPDRSIFNFFKPMRGMERVTFATDPEFERRFEVYAFAPAEAASVIDADVRQMLLHLRQEGRVFAYLGGDNALVASSGSNRFEPGSMLRSTPAEERVRRMFDEVGAGMAILRRLRAAVG